MDIAIKKRGIEWVNLSGDRDVQDLSSWEPPIVKCVVACEKAIAEEWEETHPGSIITRWNFPC